jgi:adenylate cyclase
LLNRFYAAACTVLTRSALIDKFEVKDFTTVGDVVNAAARLQSAAGGGQIVLSERLFDRLASRPGNATATTLGLRGKQDGEPARVIDLGASARERTERRACSGG